MKKNKRTGGRVTRSPRYTGLRLEHGKANRQFWRWLYEATDQAVYDWITRPRIGDTKPSAKPAVFKPRDHFKADGTAKTYRTRAGAKEYAQEMGSGFHAYQCSVCQHWHIGHDKPRRAA